MDLSLDFFVGEQNVLLETHELLSYLLDGYPEIMQEDDFAFLQLLDILAIVVVGVLVLAVELVQVDLDGFVGVAPMAGSAQGADQRVFVALAVQADQVDLFVAVAFLRAVDVLYYVGGDFGLHCQRYILKWRINKNINCSSIAQQSSNVLLVEMLCLKKRCWIYK